jgi:uroporphyrinogen III methyltransferase/synthase
MGVGNLPQIVEQLVAHGRPPDTPVALVRWGTMPDQQTVSGTLVNIVERVESAQLKPPAVAVVGQVARLGEQLRWFEDRPLFGQRVLVSRSREQASVLSSQLQALGAEAIELPTIRIAPPENWGPLDRAIAELPSYDWIVFTSVNGVGHFWERLTRTGLDARALHGARLAAIGPATAAELKARGLRADYVPGEYVAEAVAAGLVDVYGQRVLLPRADIARPALVDLLREGGAEAVEVTAYRTLRPEVDARELCHLLARITVATFTSSSTVRNLTAMTRDAGLDLSRALEQSVVACIGPITAKTARELGLQVHVVAEEYTIDGLVGALIRHLGNRGS